MWDRIEGGWDRFRRYAQHEWARLGDRDLDDIDGRRERLAGRVRDAYGVSDDEAEKQVAAWEAEMRARFGGSDDPEVSTLDNEGPEFGQDDRPGGAGLPSNQAGGRDGGPPDPATAYSGAGIDSGGRRPGNDDAYGPDSRRADGREGGDGVTRGSA